MFSSELPGIFSNSLTSYSRFKTREVKVGDLIIGGNNPVRVQSMTTTDTMNTIATVEQSIRMIDAGCELVRITAPSINEAKNLSEIKKELNRRGYFVPLVADIHFTPNAAETAARIVEKVRVNPGNYADKKKFETIDYTDLSYDAELDRIRERFTPLIQICKEYGTAMRIGTNHGSLSDRILSRYGDTPLGMVESAMEFLRICEDNKYYNIVLSMKASNTQVMVQAYRLLVATMVKEKMNYPLHLGVTEAGDGEDGRIKSSVGIGTLMEDGLGDTIRVSLTEDPEFEIPVAKALVERYYTREKDQQPITSINISELFPGKNNSQENNNNTWSPFDYSRRKTNNIINTGGHSVPVVIVDFSNEKIITPELFISVGYRYSAKLDKWNISDQACDYIYAGNISPSFELPGTLGIIVNHHSWNKSFSKSYPLFTVADFINAKEKSDKLNFILIDAREIFSDNFPFSFIDNTCVFILTTSNPHGMAEQRRFFFELLRKNISSPVIIKRTYDTADKDILTLESSTDAGALFIDGFGDGIWIDDLNCSAKEKNSISFGILQAARTRISKTEYISCPSCGRTLFDLQETTAKIRSRTSHLKGIKIGIMGCIVNGPGEMADADYGYVGTGPGKITLYKGKEVVQRNIDSVKAVDALIELIRSNGDWIEMN